MYVKYTRTFYYIRRFKTVKLKQSCKNITVTMKYFIVFIMLLVFFNTAELHPIDKVISVELADLADGTNEELHQV